MTLWDFALEAWERPEVAGACLDLQDQHGQCVTLLLWRAWAAAEGRPAHPQIRAQAIELARAWESGVIVHLRAARRGLAERPEAVDAPIFERLRKALRSAELEAEETLIKALEALTPEPAGAHAGSLARVLASLMDSWNGSRAETAALSLAAALR
ncbi:MAG: TIGR02444 family protein [Caulobacteraceae bacterium]